jgi:hypothetical protein
LIQRQIAAVATTQITPRGVRSAAVLWYSEALRSMMHVHQPFSLLGCPQAMPNFGMATSAGPEHGGMGRGNEERAGN